MPLTRPFSPAALCFALASAILAFEPLRWLVRTWFDPSYPSLGAIYFVAIAGLLAWSLSSPVADRNGHSGQYALILLVLAAAIRFISQVMAINVIGGLALALDIFALATLLRLGDRARPVSAFWLSVLFLFTLPVERILQRLLGYPLQLISADLSCGLLGLFFDDLVCSGARLQLAGREVFVDLPCSGTSGLMLSMAFVTILNALYRPKLTAAAIWICAALLAGVLGNTLRVSILAVGLAHPDAFAGLDVMAEPLHSMIGYATLALSMAPILLFYKPTPAPRSGTGLKLPLPTNRPVRNLSALVFLALALIIVNLPRQALDVSKDMRPLTLPTILNGAFGQKEQLLPIEEAYLSAYGGHAEKRRYGPLSLTLVNTSSPLRHLHAPDDCLRGLGYRVAFLGTRFDPVPTALYRATSPADEQWQVAVSFTSDEGHITHNIAEAIWLWLNNPQTTWTSIQRITPWHTPDAQQQRIETAVIAALDLPQS